MSRAGPSERPSPTRGWGRGMSCSEQSTATLAGVLHCDSELCVCVWKQQTGTCQVSILYYKNAISNC